MSKSIWDIIFRRNEIEAEDISRVRKVMAAHNRSEQALLRSLELQAQVASFARRNKKGK